MAGEPQITVVGNLTADPELKVLANGTSLATFTVASTPRFFDRRANDWKDGETLFLRCTVWREYAENVVNSLSKGMRVIAQGTLRQNNYETREGERRTSYELQIDEVGPALRSATAQVTRNASRGQGGGGFGGGQPSGQPSWGQPAAPQEQDNPWANPGGAPNTFGSGFDDDQPF